MATHSRTFAPAMLALLGVAIPAVVIAQAQPSHPAAAAQLFARFLLPASVDYSLGDWDTARKVSGVQWGKGPLPLDKATPDGDFFAMPGRATIGGRPVMLVANGARTMVSNIYLLDPQPLASPEGVAAGFKAAGFTLAPARCTIGNRPYPDARRWYRITYPAKRPAFLYAAPLKSGGTGYILYLGGLPAMSERDADLYTDDCSGKAAPAPGLRTGTEAVVALIDRLMRPVGAPPALSWAEVQKLPALSWHPPLRKLTVPYPPGGDDPNPYTLDGALDTPTTKSEARVTGNAQAATRFYFLGLDHMRPTEVFDRLRAQGYRIAAVRCGKPYTKMSENWFAIAAPGKRPAILYRSAYFDTGTPVMNYVLRIDNVIPPIAQGQRPAPPAGCPDLFR